MKAKLAAAVVVLLLVALGAWWYFSPFLALRELQQAARAGDAPAFNAHVDYPRVRQSLKVQLSGLLAQKLGASNESGNPLAALGGMIGQRLIDPLVDALVRPETVMAAMQNGRLAQPAPGPALPAPVPAPEAGAAPGTAMPPAAPAPGSASAPNPSPPEPPRWSIHREGLNRVTAYAADPARPDAPNTERLGLIFERSGFVDWRLTAIQLPASGVRAP